MVKDDLLYSKDHEWVKISGQEALIGITDYAQSELGDITFIELPAVGKEVKQAAIVSTIESVKSASDIFAPLSGTVSEVNQVLEDSPELINTSCYDKGWICKITIRDPSEQVSLLSADAYRSLIQES